MTQYDHTQIGSRLRLIRESKNLSQYNFAQKANIREKTYWQYETNRVIPPLHRLVLICNAHEISIEDLLKVEST